MPPRRRSTSGYHGVRAWPSGHFDAEIRSGDERIRLSTFDTAHEVGAAYGAVARRLGRSRRTMNFHDVWTREQAEQLAPRRRSSRASSSAANESWSSASSSRRSTFPA
nr:ethylene-responsive transcription factor ERF084-like [Lolium perenne]